jgi:FAD/FMN-containing dehydrogenase
MAHRKSPRRIEKQRRIERLKTIHETAIAKTGVPREELMWLEAAILGKIVMPGEPGYDEARQEANPAFQAYPQIIVYCEVPLDVEACLIIAIKTRLQIAIRSGGHSSAGYSVNNGIVIDVSSLDSISIDTVAKTAKVGPGVDFDRLNAALDAVALHVPSGACGNVCVGGFMQGGGYGYTSRAFGMNCDNVIDVQVMLWNGGTVRANAAQNIDLFWAIRGGTGGNFGIVLEVTYKLQTLPSVWAFAIQWDVSQAAAVLLELQRNYTSSGAPPELGYMMNVGYNGGAPVALIQGMYCGDSGVGKQAVASLMAIPTAQLLVDISGPYGKMDQYLDDNPYPIPNPPPGIKEDKICGYIASPLALSDWQAIVDQFYRTPSQVNVLYTEPYGGAINAFPIDGNAFIHRSVDLNLVIDATWMADSEKPAAEAWLLGYQNLMQTYFGEEIYQNYPRRSYEQFRMNYWGTAFPKLLCVKRKYDPHNIFRYQQGISPYPTADSSRGPSEIPATPLADVAIAYERPPNVRIRPPISV